MSDVTGSHPVPDEDAPNQPETAPDDGSQPETEPPTTTDQAEAAAAVEVAPAAEAAGPVEDAPADQAPAELTSAADEEEPATPEPATQEPAVPEPDLGAGQHAAPRPYPPTVARVPVAESRTAAAAPTAPLPATAWDPTGATAAVVGPAPQTPQTPPPPPPVPATPDAPVPPPAADATAAAAAATVATGLPPVPGPPPPAAAPGPEEPLATRRAQRRDRVELPELPPKPGASRHVLGVLVGLVLTPIALVLLTVGLGGLRTFDAEAGETLALDPTNLALVGGGALALAAVVLLGLWSPAVPLTGGLLWGVGVGALYLGWPAVVQDGLDAAYSTRPPALDQLVSRLDDGTWFALGLLLVAAGLTAGLARRIGRRFGERWVLADRARAEVLAAEESRRQAADAAEAALADRARSL